jgi:hypothetical protein
LLYRIERRKMKRQLKMRYVRLIYKAKNHYACRPGMTVYEETPYRTA